MIMYLLKYKYCNRKNPSNYAIRPPAYMYIVHVAYHSRSNNNNRLDYNEMSDKTKDKQISRNKKDVWSILIKRVCSLKNISLSTKFKSHTR